MISKSNFMQFMRCSCELWVMKQRKDLAPEVDAGLQRKFDEGNQVDEIAHKLFPGAKMIDGFGATAAKATSAAIEAGERVLLQPTFVTKDLMCRCDILVKNDDGSWDIHEVKSATKVKEEHVLDMAFQRICLQEAGVKIDKTFLVHVNNSFVRQGEIDPDKFFTSVDISHEVEDVTPMAKKQIPNALAVLDWDLSPGLIQAKSCSNPAECEFLACYFREIESEQINSIATGLPKKQLIAFLERGLIKPENVPADLLAELPELKIPGTTEPVISIDKEAIKADFDELVFPLYFLDYETYLPAVPPFDGYRPYENAVFQYSIHVLRAPGGELEHFEFIAEELADHATAIVDSLKSHLGDKGSVIVWFARFEASRNAELARRVPASADFMADINDRIYDLMMIVKKGYYVDSRFGGSASLKKVLPVMCPELSYSDLNIREGGTASVSWGVLTDPATPADKKAKLKSDMLAYCERDTLAMVEIYRRLLGVIS